VLPNGLSARCSMWLPLALKSRSRPQPRRLRACLTLLPHLPEGPPKAREEPAPKPDLRRYLADDD
jgi:hypothetical protein